jgi:hypothetical protein
MQLKASQVKKQMCELQEVQRWCNWTPDAADQSYLRSFNTATLLAAAGWTLEGNERTFFSERFHIEVVPSKLISHLSIFHELTKERFTRFRRSCRCEFMHPNVSSRYQTAS